MSKPTLTTYGGLLRDLGYAGELVNQNPTVIETKVNDQATVLDFGVAVCRSAADGTCKAPALDADKIIGITVRHAIRPVYDATNDVGYQQWDAVPILKEGYIYAIPPENVTRGDQVLSLTAQAGKLGGVTGGAAGAGRVAVPNATWETTTTTGNVGVIRINN